QFREGPKWCHYLPQFVKHSDDVRFWFLEEIAGRGMKVLPRDRDKFRCLGGNRHAEECTAGIGLAAGRRERFTDAIRERIAEQSFAEFTQVIARPLTAAHILEKLRVSFRRGGR